MSNDQTEYLTIGQLCRLYPGSRGARHMSPSTVVRWILHGCVALHGERVKLAAVRCGTRWLVRVVDLEHFFKQLAATPSAAEEHIPVTVPKSDSCNRATAELRRRGA